MTSQQHLLWAPQWLTHSSGDKAACRIGQTAVHLFPDLLSPKVMGWQLTPTSGATWRASTNLVSVHVTLPGFCKDLCVPSSVPVPASG